MYAERTEQLKVKLESRLGAAIGAVRTDLVDPTAHIGANSNVCNSGLETTMSALEMPSFTRPYGAAPVTAVEAKVAAIQAKIAEKLVEIFKLEAPVRQARHELRLLEFAAACEADTNTDDEYYLSSFGRLVWPSGRVVAGPSEWKRFEQPCDADEWLVANGIDAICVGFIGKLTS